jgi:hypothetical protein
MPDNDRKQDRQEGRPLFLTQDRLVIDMREVAGMSMNTPEQSLVKVYLIGGGVLEIDLNQGFKFSPNTETLRLALNAWRDEYRSRGQ